MIAWFAIVITGRYPQGLYDFVAGFTRFVARVTAYAALLCDPYPPFSGATDAAYPMRMEFAGPLEQLQPPEDVVPHASSRSRSLILRYVMNLLLEIGARRAPGS